MYSPVEKAIASVQDFVIPGEYRVQLFASRDEVSETYDGVGTKFRVMGKLSEMDGAETAAKVFEDFVVPNDEADVEKLENRTSAKGNTYVDTNYAKFKKLQGVLKAPISSIECVLEMFETAKVSWTVNLELSAASKDKEKNPRPNWSQITDWFEEHGGEKAKLTEKDGTEYLRWTLYNSSPENLAIIEEATGLPGIRLQNTLSGFKKPRNLK